jgi:glucosamine-6-phosphate deaminase
MQIHVHPDPTALGAAAGNEAAAVIRDTLATQGAATIVVATGASQFATLATLVAAPGIDWGCVTVFHLDEYAGLAADHPASFRRYLRERFVDRLPTAPRAFHPISAGTDPAAECRRLARLVPAGPFDLALIGIGENGHLAFNDPPADFTTTAPYLVVDLDEACRRQQVGEGWFPDLARVPTQAISMSVRRILASRRIVCSVPDTRKAVAVRGAVEGPVDPRCPASILREAPGAVSLHLDTAAAQRLTGKT